METKQQTAATARHPGVDLARGLAVLGMVVVNIRLVSARFDDHPRWLRMWVGMLDGRSAATFVTLAGLGAGLALVSARTRPDGEQPAALRRARLRLLRRGAFLFGAGLVLLSPLVGWTADILHFYGVYLVVGAALFTASDRWLLGAAAASAVAAALVIATGHYFDRWDPQTLDYQGLFTIDGFTRNLFVDGYHPVLGWLTFYLFGMWMGRQNLRDPRWRRRLAIGAAATVAAAEALGWLVVAPKGVTVPDLAPHDLRWLFSAEPVPPSPVYLLAGGATAVLVILAALRLAELLPRPVTEPLVSTGRMALTLYVAHIVIGMGALEAVDRLYGQTLKVAVTAALAINTAAVLTAWLTLRRYRHGPLEALMRRLAG